MRSNKIKIIVIHVIFPQEIYSLARELKFAQRKPLNKNMTQDLIIKYVS